MIKERKRSFAQNYIFNLLYQVIVVALPLVITPYLSRILGADKIGQYSFAQSIVSCFAFVAALGTAIYGQRQIARVNDDPEERSRLFWEILLFRIVGVIISAATFCFTILPLYSEHVLLYIVAAIEIIAVAFDISWFYQGMEDFRPIAICTAVGRLLAMIAIFVFVKDKNDLVIYVICFCGSVLLGNISAWKDLPKYLVKTSVKSFRLKKHIVPVFSLFSSQFAIQIYAVVDKTMIGLITRSDFENGYYEQSQKLIKALIALVTSLGVVIASRVTVLWKEERKKDVYDLIYGSFRFVFALGLPMAVGCMLVLSRFVPVFYGAGFEPIIPVIAILTFVLPVLGCSNVTGIQLLVPTEREKKLTLSVIAGVCVNVLLNAFLIYFFAAKGAALASVIAELVITSVQLWFLRKEISLKRVLQIFLRYAFFTLIMGAVGLVLLAFAPSGILGILVIAVVCIAVYGSLLLITKDPVFAFFKSTRS